MNDDDPWKCGYCGRHHVVPALARECERKHEDEVQHEPECEGVD